MKKFDFSYQFIAITNLVLITLNVYAQPTAVRNFEFIENKGQWDNPSVCGVMLNNAQLYIEKNALQYFFYNEKDIARLAKHPRLFKEDFDSYQVRGNALRITFINSSDQVAVVPISPFHHYYNYFLGNNRMFWTSGVKPSKQLMLKGLYRGIDLNYYTDETGLLKYDFILAPNADPASIQLLFEGADNISLEAGMLVVKTAAHDYTELQPVAYQEIEGQTVNVKSMFQLKDNRLSFKMGSYNRNLPLVIDPQVIFSTYSGSTADNFGHTATYDNDGNFYAAGIVTFAYSAYGRYPATNGAFMLNYSGGTSAQWPQLYFPCDISISKYNNDGTSLLYATYLGGTSNDYPHSLVVDRNNQLIVFGSTCSADFPVTSGAYDTTFNSTTLPSSDIIVTKFKTDGTGLIGSTYLGGSYWDGVMIADSMRMNYADEFRGEVQVNNVNEILIATTTYSSDFPTTSGVYQPISKGQQEACVIKFDSTLKHLIWSTYLGDSSNDAAYSLDLDTIGNVYIAGGTQSYHFPVTSNAVRKNYSGGPVDGFVSKISANGASLLQSTYFGGPAYDQAYFIKLDPNGKVNVFGQTFDSIPVTSGVISTPQGSLYISRLSARLDSIEFSTLIGNHIQNNAISPSAFMVDACGNIYASCWGGTTNYYGNGRHLFGGSFYSGTSGLPVTSTAVQSTTDNSDFYLFVLKKDATALFYGSFLGGNLTSDHVDGGTSRFDKRGVIYQSICASCPPGYIPVSDFPTTPNSYAPVNLSPRCSNASYKLDFRLGNVIVADFSSSPRNGCTDTMIYFTNNSYNGKNYYWFVDNVYKDTTRNFTFSFANKGNHSVKLVVVDSSACIIKDSIAKIINIQPSSKSNFTYLRDSCSFGLSFFNTSSTKNNDSVPSLWIFSDGFTSTVNNPSHIFNSAGLVNVGLITNYGNQCADTARKSIYLDTTIYMLEAKFSVQPPNVCLPSKVLYLNQSINGRHFYWYYNFILKDSIKQLTDSFITAQTVIVTLVVKDSVSCKKSDTVSHQVVASPRVIADFSFRLDSCARVYYFTNKSNSPQSDPIKYFWEFGDGDTSSQKNPIHKYLSNGGYVVKLVCNQGSLCADSNIQLIIYDSNANYIVADFNPAPLNGCAPQLLVCDNVTNSHGKKFYWYLNNVLVDSNVNFIDTLKDVGQSRVKLTVKDYATCNKSDSVTKTVWTNISTTSKFSILHDTCTSLIRFINQSSSYQNINVSYLWDFGDSTFFYDRDPPPHQYPVNGQYTITLYTGSLPCFDSSKITFDYDSLSFLLRAKFLLADTLLCVPQFLQAINLSSRGQHYKWYMNNLLKDTNVNFSFRMDSTGTVQVKLVVVDNATCNQEDSMTKAVFVDELSNTAFEPVRDTCDPFITFINKTITYKNQSVAYMWDFGDNSSSILKNPLPHLYPRNGNYTVTLISGNLPCLDTMKINVLYDSLAHILKAGFNLQDTILCVPQMIKATNTSTGGKQFYWYINSVLKDTSRNLNHSIDSSGIVKVKLVVMDSARCKLSDTIERTIITSFSSKADFGIGRDSCSLQVLFINKTTGGNTPILWIFGDGDSTMESNPSHLYSHSGTYPVILISNPGSFCADTVVKKFFFDGDSTEELRVPNVFTPNNDGINDLFEIKGVSWKCDQFHIIVYNRWGTDFFESYDPRNSWNGKNNQGIEASEGVYFFILEVKKHTGKQFKMRGTVTLIIGETH